jgi:hypothetical protein
MEKPHDHSSIVDAPNSPIYSAWCWFGIANWSLKLWTFIYVGSCFKVVLYCCLGRNQNRAKIWDPVRNSSPCSEREGRCLQGASAHGWPMPSQSSVRSAWSHRQLLSVAGAHDRTRLFSPPLPLSLKPMLKICQSLDFRQAIRAMSTTEDKNWHHRLCFFYVSANNERCIKNQIMSTTSKCGACKILQSIAVSSTSWNI